MYATFERTHLLSLVGYPTLSEAPALLSRASFCMALMLSMLNSVRGFNLPWGWSFVGVVCRQEPSAGPLSILCSQT